LILKRGVCHVEIIERITTMEDRLPARVFISCGQRMDTDEVQVARDIEAEFRKLGFDPYVAVEEQRQPHLAFYHQTANRARASETN
jgi:hypothetical protein